MNSYKVEKDLTKRFKQLLGLVNRGEGFQSSLYLDFYSIVQNYSDMGDPEAEIMYQLHSKLIKLFLNEYTKTLKKTSNIDFIILFNNKINKIKILLYYSSNSFIV